MANKLPEVLRTAISDQRIEIPVNQLLDSEGPKLTRDQFAMLMTTYRAASAMEVEKPKFFAALDLLTDDFLDMVDRRGGATALFQLHMMLVKSGSAFEARHFCTYVRDSSRFEQLSGLTKLAPFAPDNAALPASRDLDRFAHNVMNPALSRKLFNPGTNDGYLVYGLGRPRVLVSLPFKGGSQYFYDVYANSIDVVTSLGVRGYFGSFLLFDYIGGLDDDFDGLPAWLVFFSAVATNADAVIFVTERSDGMTDSQRLEAAYTPDRVPKKIVTLDTNELGWATHDGLERDMPVLHIVPGKGLVAKDEAMAYEASNALPLIKAHRRCNFPNDRLIVIGEHAALEVFPDGRRVERPF